MKWIAIPEMSLTLEPEAQRRHRAARHGLDRRHLERRGRGGRRRGRRRSPGRARTACSDIAAGHPGAAAPQLVEEGVDRLARPRAARDPLPADPDHPDQPVALVDRRDRELVRSPKRLTISASPSGSRSREHRVGCASRSQASRSSSHSVAPAGLGYKATTRAGIARAHEEGEADRDPERCPDLLRQLEVRRARRRGRRRAGRPLARAHRPAGLAGADDAPLVEVQQVAVVGPASGVRRGRSAPPVGAGAGRRRPSTGPSAARARVAGAARRGRAARRRARPSPGCGGRRRDARGRLRSPTRAHPGSATRIEPSCASSGTGSSCRLSSSSERPARGR